MGTKRLFDEKEEWTEEGRRIDTEFQIALGEVFARYENTHSLRDLHYIAIAAVQDVGLTAIINYKQEVKVKC